MIYAGEEGGGKKTMQGITTEHTNRQLTPTRTACDVTGCTASNKL